MLKGEVFFVFEYKFKIYIAALILEMWSGAGSHMCILLSGNAAGLFI